MLRSGFRTNNRVGNRERATISVSAPYREDLWGASPFEVVDIAHWTPDQDEPSGENEKTWFRAPDGSRWVFKPNRPRRSLFENSAELAASLIAVQLRIPAAKVRLASLDGTAGCVSMNVVSSERNQLENGSVFISEFVDNFDPKDKLSRGHSLTNILRVLDHVEPPIGAIQSSLSASGWFAGYLLFDALIGNRDRHSENWAIEITEAGTRHLAPSYDHATSLGIVVRHAGLAKTIGSQQAINAFAQNATAYRFQGHRDDSLVDVAGQFARLCGTRALRYWQEEFSALAVQAAMDVVAGAKMSPGNATLAQGIIRYNQERILACLNS
ncbi:hypothetical protein RCH07_000592 [Arthrobacter sp. CG_A4]|nr:hypothetical protein [Arthrobacter sp. CG_A4]